jgi:hypothetical protein
MAQWLVGWQALAVGLRSPLAVAGWQTVAVAALLAMAMMEVHWG